MTKKLYLPLLMAMVVALFSSCSKKMGELSADYFTVTPQVLEAVGGKVPATINGNFLKKYFNKKSGCRRYSGFGNGMAAKLKANQLLSKVKKWKVTTRLSLTRWAVATL